MNILLPEHAVGAFRIVYGGSYTKRSTFTMSGGTTTTTSTPYSQAVTDTVVNHYVAGRLTLNGYLQLGAEYGYTPSITLYLCGSTWTNSSTGGPLH